MEILQQIIASLRSLGRGRLILLALSGLGVLGLVTVSSYMLSTPPMQTLYTGLEAEDVSRIGVALGQAGTPFEVSSDGKSVLVPASETLKARMLLAESGLPRSPGSGYELFDSLGSLGLTSFMQEITRLRALEGELARTIQLVEGVKSARVHLVLPDRNAFRLASQQTSASVIVRLDRPDRSLAAEAIRHLVAAAVPDLTVDHVSLLTTDGKLVASDAEGGGNGSGTVLSLESTVSDGIRDRISRTLAPQLGVENYQISVAVKLNTDRKQVNETIYDPESKVERSVRVIRDTGNSKGGSNDWSVSVVSEIPDQSSDKTGSGSSSEEKQHREELTNYELSSKVVSTDTAGYAVERLSVAVVINRKQLAHALGDKMSEEAVKQRTAELQELVASAAGLQVERGDKVTVTTADFVENAEPEHAASDGLMALLSGNLGVMINAVTVLALAGLIIAFGLRPMARSVMQADERPLAIAGGAPPLALRQAVPVERAAMAAPAAVAGPGKGEDSGGEAGRANRLQQNLRQVVEMNEDRAVGVMRQWLQQAS